jgi:hypothetical protein
VAFVVAQMVELFVAMVLFHLLVAVIKYFNRKEKV